MRARLHQRHDDAVQREEVADGLLVADDQVERRVAVGVPAVDVRAAPDQQPGRRRAREPGVTGRGEGNEVVRRGVVK